MGEKIVTNGADEEKTYLFDSLHFEPFGCRVNFLDQLLVCLESITQKMHSRYQPKVKNHKEMGLRVKGQSCY